MSSIAGSLPSGTSDSDLRPSTVPGAGGSFLPLTGWLTAAEVEHVRPTIQLEGAPGGTVIAGRPSRADISATVSAWPSKSQGWVDDGRPPLTDARQWTPAPPPRRPRTRGTTLGRAT